MDERTKKLMEVVMMTKARLNDQFNEQLDLYRKGQPLGLVTRFSEDQPTRYRQLAASVACFGADEVVHASEAWVRSIPPEEAEAWEANYRRGDLANDPHASEVLVVTRVTRQSFDSLVVPFTESDGELVYGETEDVSDGNAQGAVLDALRVGLREGWRNRLPPKKAAKLLSSFGLMVIVEAT